MRWLIIAKVVSLLVEVQVLIVLLVFWKELRRAWIQLDRGNLLELRGPGGGDIHLWRCGGYVDVKADMRQDVTCPGHGRNRCWAPTEECFLPAENWFQAIEA